MKIILTYQRYSRQLFSVDDFIEDLAKKIDKTFKPLISKVRTLYYPINDEEVLEFKKKGIMTLYHDGFEDKGPRLVIKEFDISFKVDSEGFQEVRDYLIELYGENCTKVSCIDEIYLNNVG